MHITIVGCGPVGLVSGLCLAAKGHQVIGIDVDAAKVADLNCGQLPFYEAGLDQLLQTCRGKTFQASTDLAAAVHSSQLTMLAVGTPFGGETIDLSQIETAAHQVGLALRDHPGYHLVVVKSTVVPGTTETVVLPKLEAASGKQAGVDFGVAMNPEFLREGTAVEDFMEPDRIVLGGLDARSIERLQELYAVFPDATQLTTSCRTAEMIKYAANSLLATLISFTNEIGNLCGTLGGIDIVDVMAGVHMDYRFTPRQPGGERLLPGMLAYLQAGCGFGGSCFPKDVQALCAFGHQHGQPMDILQAVMGVNRLQYQQVLQRLQRHFPDLSQIAVAVLGLAFKPGTDDLRESPAIPVIQHLLAHNARVTAYDPAAMAAAAALPSTSGIDYSSSLADAVANADAIVIMTAWPEFKSVPELIAKRPQPPLIVDGRRLLPKNSVPRYEGIGL